MRPFLSIIEKTLDALNKEDSKTYIKAIAIFTETEMQVLSYGPNTYEVLLNLPGGDEEITLYSMDEKLLCERNGGHKAMDAIAAATAMYVREEATKFDIHEIAEGRAYTREGMVQRVLKERRQKALSAPYRIKFAGNLYGEHLLTNEYGKTYRVTLRDFENETGYINNPDWKYNKLGTTKHIMFAFKALKEKPALMKKMSHQYPFVEIYTDPLNDYRITWHYPHPLPADPKKLIEKHFGKKKFIADDAVKDFLLFLKAAKDQPEILVRPEVDEKVNLAWENEMLAVLKAETRLNFSVIKHELFPYQREGVAFATFKMGAIIADEMGLGKTVQAIATAIFKKQVFGFGKTLVVCPASLKAQWKNEVEKYSTEKAVIADGFPSDRQKIYRSDKSFFTIVNYETVLRDWKAINNAGFDFIILDEAQRIKNFSTVTAQSVKWLQKKHCLVITGTPIENKLIDLYSVMQFVKPELLGPLWEFSYKHCYFDVKKADKITGYYDLQQLNAMLKEVLIRREKRNVLKDLPNITQKDIPVSLTIDQASYHASYASGIAQIIHKKFLTPYDLQKLQLLLTSMRMVCDSTFLIDKETNVSPKLDELKYMLVEQFDLLNADRKIIIFSEWVTMLGLIGKMLTSIGISYVQLTGKVAVKNRQAVVKKFEENKDCKVFLSSDAGGTGLNLQVADTVINFELPWNPGKKNQRIGRIDRLGQRSKHLTVINFITLLSIEEKIAEGLVLKQNLFEGVLNASNKMNVVDFSTKGRSQFLKQLENFIDSYSVTTQTQVIDEQETITPNPALLHEQTDMFEVAVSEPDILTPLEETVEDGIEKVVQPQLATTAETMQQVMNNGMQFLAGLFKMTTGTDMPLAQNSIEVDKETGEVIMRFKMK